MRSARSLCSRVSFVGSLCLAFTTMASSQNPSLTQRRPLRSGDTATDIYTALITSAQSATGNLHLTLQGFDGRTASDKFGQAGVWHIDPNTTVRVDFSFDAEGWKKLTLDFPDHPISLQLAVDTPAPGFLKIGKIIYGRDGTVGSLYAPDGGLISNFYRRGLDSGTPIGFYSPLLSHIRIPPQLSALLLGRGLSKGPFIFSSATLQEPHKDGLEFVLASSTTLPIGAKKIGSCDPDLTFSSSVPITWTSLSYVGKSGYLEATIGSFSTDLAGGCLAGGGTELRISSGKDLQVSTLEFGQSSLGKTSHVLLRASSLDATLTPGSKIALGITGNRTSIVAAGGGGAVKANDLQFGITNAGYGLLVLGVAQSSLLNTRATLAMDTTDFWTFTEQQSSLTFNSASWVDSSDPSVDAAFAPGNIAVSAGLLTFGAGARLYLGEGTATLGRLFIHTSSEPQITGAIPAGEIGIAPNSSIGVETRFNMQIGAGGALHIRTPNQFAFITNQPGPRGDFTADAPMITGRLDFGANGQLPITSGHAHLAITANGNSQFTGTMGGHLNTGAGSIPFSGSTLVATSHGSLTFDALNISSSSGLIGPLSALSLNIDSSKSIIVSPSLTIAPEIGAIIEKPTSGKTVDLSDAGIVGGLHLSADFNSGQAIFAPTSSVTLAGGHLDGLLTRSVTGSVSGTLALSANVSGGQVGLDADTSLPVGPSSRIVSERLQLESDGGISGPLPTLHLALSPGKMLRATNGRLLSLIAPSTYDSDSITPLNFVDKGAFPVGDGRLSVHFSLLKYRATPKVTLRNGELSAHILAGTASPLIWNSLSVKGEQFESYNTLSELPVDEYKVLSRLPSGKVQEIVAPNRIMLVNNIPIAVGSPATFDDTGHVTYARLARDTTVFGLPLAGGTRAEVNVERASVVSGTLGADTTIAGIPFTKGCLAHLPPTDADKLISPCELVTTLAARITTSNDLLASDNDPLLGKPDDIWLDIGPKAWLISGKGDFSRGATTTITIDDPNTVDGGDCSALVPRPVPLYVGDIVKVRLEKKGIWLPKICGVANGPDSTVDLGQLLPTKPSDALNTMSAQIQLDREQLQLQKQAIDSIANEIGTLQDAIKQAQAIIDQGTNLTHKVTDIQNQILDIRHELLTLPDQVCHNETVQIGICVALGPACLITNKLVCAANPLIQQLNDKATQLEKDLNSANADAAAFAIKVQAALAAEATDAQLQVTKQTLLTADQLEYDALNKLADGLDSAISDLKTLIDNIVPGIDIPLPGQWKPDSVTLVVNGRDYVTFNNGYGRLRQGHSEWENPVRRLSGGEYFVQGMRTNINTPGCASSGGEEECGWDVFLTTPFAKMRGYSGWDSIPDLGNVTVTGVLRNNPSPGHDVYVSLDLQVTSVDVGGRTIVPGDVTGIHGPRYVRIEYLHEGDERFDSSHENWKIGDTLRVTGPVFRDRDRTTFFEIHARGSSNISRVSQ